MKISFLRRFHLEDYEEEIKEKLCNPTQKIGKSVKAYLARYQILHVETRPDAMMLDQHKKHWISGLSEELKKDVMMVVPENYQEAVDMAHVMEMVMNNIKCDTMR